MKFSIKPVSAGNFGSSFIGDSEFHATQIAGLSECDSSCITYYKGDDIQKIKNIEAGILITEPISEESITGFKSRAIVFSKNPKYDFIRIISENYENTFEIDPEADKIDSTAKIAHSAFIESTVTIKKSTHIFPNSSILGTALIGENCMIQSGSVIGAIGLGHVYNEGKYHRFVQLGKTIIEDNVDIGANVTVLRGIMEKTIIGEGTKIGNNVNIGHNTIIGKNCYISSGATIGGACIIEDNCWISPGVTISDHIHVAAHSKLGVGAVVIKDTLPNSFYLGNPARKISDNQ